MNTIKKIKAIYYGFCMILWDVVFCLHSVAYWFINVDGVLNCLDLIIQTVFISCKIRRQQLNRIASSNDVTLPKDKNGIIIKYILKEDLFNCVYFQQFDFSVVQNYEIILEFHQYYSGNVYQNSLEIFSSVFLHVLLLLPLCSPVSTVLYWSTYSTNLLYSGLL